MSRLMSVFAVRMHFSLRLLDGSHLCYSQDQEDLQESAALVELQERQVPQVCQDLQAHQDLLGSEDNRGLQGCQEYR